MQLITNDDGSVQSTETVQLDCRYEGNRHLTVTVPGNDISCELGPLPGAPKIRTLVCTTRAEEMPGPITVSLAEPVTERTAMSGFALRRDREAIREVGRRRGYEERVTITSDDGLPLEILFTAPGERLAVRFSPKTGLSKRVELYKHRGMNDVDFYGSVVLRFGFARKYTTASPHGDRWTSADSQITVDLTAAYQVEADILILTDHAAKD